MIRAAKNSLLLAFPLLSLALSSVGAPLSSGGLVLIAKAGQLSEGTVVSVLGYGRLGNGAGKLSRERFERQLLYLKTSGVQPVSLDDFLLWRAGRKNLPPRCVLLTFDEARDDFYAQAYPILKRHAFPFVLFVEGKNLQGAPGYVSPGQLREMQQFGAEIGSHSLNRRLAEDWKKEELAHPLGGQAMADAELGESASLIRKQLGRCRAFSYPDGYSDVLIMSKMALHGYCVAFSQTRGKVSADAPAYLLNRYMVENDQAFAAAMNFGEPGGEAAILDALDSSVPSAPEPAPEPVQQHASPQQPAIAITSESAQQPAIAAMPAYSALLDALPDDDVAEEVEEAEDGESVAAAETKTPAATPAAPLAVAEVEEPPLAICGMLGKRTPNSDWVTVRFAKPLVPREQTQVAVLGYHNFSNTKPISEMRMRTAEFCQQMQYIKDAGLSVISMQDFLEWRLGARCLPARCVLITIDDGWKSVYSDAYPVLKAYGYPFTLFLYTRYINAYGDSMTSAQIREMMANGATIGSHSTNHLYPSKWKRFAEDSPAYAEQVQREIPDSCTRLKEMFGNCSAYCYPGGYHTPPMLAALEASPFQAAFTVVEQKVTCEESPYLVHRYMVFGVDPKIFRRAVNFDGAAGVAPVCQGIAAAEAKARAFFPKAFEGLGAAPATAHKKPAAAVPSAKAKAAHPRRVPRPSPAVQQLRPAKPQPEQPQPAPAPERPLLHW